MSKENNMFTYERLIGFFFLTRFQNIELFKFICFSDVIRELLSVRSMRICFFDELVLNAIWPMFADIHEEFSVVLIWNVAKICLFVREKEMR